MGRHSSSDSERRDSKRKKKKGSRKHSRSRSRSPSYSHRSSKSSSSRKRRSRSRSRSSDRSRGSSPRKKRSRSSDKHRRSSRRSRSRSASRDRHSSSRKRSRSRDRSTKSRKEKSRDRSRSPVRRKKHVDAVLGVGTGTLKDVMDIVPGFSQLTPAEQSKIRIQRALKAAAESSTKDEEAEEREKEKQKKEAEAADTREQIDRLKAIEAIADSDDDGDDAGFMPTHFKSSVKLKKKLALAESKAGDSSKTSFMERESTHEMAIFGNSSMLSLDEAIQRRKQAEERALLKAKTRIEFSRRDPESLVAEQFLATNDQLQQRWQDKLDRLREKYKIPGRSIAV